MKKQIFVTLLILLAAAITLDAADKDFPKLSGPYLGQKPPGDIPELFAPGIVSSVYWEHSGAVFTPDGKELFWSRAINEGEEPRIIVIMHMILGNDGVWGQPELASFNFHDAVYNHITSISPDGTRLYYFSSSEEFGRKMNMVDKSGNAWGEPRLFRKNANELHETQSGDVYCTGPLEIMPQGWGIVRSRLENGKYQDFESLGSHINFNFDDPFPNHSPTVDPDERFVIFVSRRPGGYGNQDLYISYRQPDDTFGPAINLGPKINTIGLGNSWPQLSPDGKYLFFVSYARPFQDIMEKRYTYGELIKIQESILNGRGNIYWVSTGFVDELRPDHRE